MLLPNHPYGAVPRRGDVVEDALNLLAQQASRVFGRTESGEHIANVDVAAGSLRETDKRTGAPVLDIA